jgi:hypothetical protein
MLRLFNRRAIRISLRTPDKKNAKVMIKAYSYRLERIYTLARSGMLTEEQLKRMVRDHLQSGLAMWEHERLKGGLVPKNDSHLANIVSFFEELRASALDERKYGRIDNSSQSFLLTRLNRVFIKYI